MEKNYKLLGFGSVLGLSLIIAALIISSTFMGIKKLDNVVSVSGSAKIAVTSDSARFTASFSRNSLSFELKEAYSQMKRDEEIVSDFFNNQGFKDQFEISPVYMFEVYKNDQNAPKEYNLTQNIALKSSDVELIKKLAKDAQQLVDKDIIFSANPVEYYYSDLPSVRISLLPNAIEDAKERVKAIAESGDRKVGQVQSVSMGVVQVMPAGAIEISDYGSYDTSSIDKEVMVTVKASFNLK